MAIDITNFSFSAPCNGLRLMLLGYSNSLPMLFRDLILALAELSVTPEVFALAKEKAETDYRNRKYQQPFLHAVLAHHRVLDAPFWSEEERLDALADLGPKDLALFHCDFLSQVCDALALCCVCGVMVSLALRRDVAAASGRVGGGQRRRRARKTVAQRAPGHLQHGPPPTAARPAHAS